jgi:ribosome-binding protein aMBF1 (putative translation factor)
MNHQDWVPVIVSKKGSPTTTSTASGYRTQAAADITRLENDEPLKKRDPVKVKTFATNLKNLRLSKRMNQKEFATMMNVKSDIVQGIESGRIVPDAKLVQSMKVRMDRMALKTG